MLDLVREGMVEVVPNTGFRVTELTDAEPDELVELLPAHRTTHYGRDCGGAGVGHLLRSGRAVSDLRRLETGTTHARSHTERNPGSPPRRGRLSIQRYVVRTRITKHGGATQNVMQERRIRVKIEQ